MTLIQLVEMMVEEQEVDPILISKVLTEVCVFAEFWFLWPTRQEHVL